ncbi:bifunctional NMN adenylyltransferase/nudix hydrolase [Oryzisolibacter propanilivorax]|uniref:Bifunctional NMN adenylyltransferase/nudix hydrolase n=1 Tax=Oryzisolibacter propanilivorax TaxID=1527607 RepID=A0A1G9VDF1_9BURK|nr:bifunctional nicotinamide-nucleotide adenylyltransferase/Nudix hydroxylase [Oryzisolibacter propanilivorax]SDM70121.1 bifunctional NMN adenylyltransferase/nudix hydrolase [Oryzisolibacter propanilivorax]
MYDVALLIGRFQPVHAGHVALLRHALAQARRVLVVAGSAYQARTPKNPFTWEERAAMLQGAVPPADAARLQVLPVRDYYDEARWVAAVQYAVAPHVQDGARVALVGHFKDATSQYLTWFPGWQLLELPRQGGMDATRIRDAWLGAAPGALDAALAPLADEIPPATLAQLRALAATPAFPALQHEWRALREYRAAWAGAPYPPVFVTVDALLQCRGQVLLIRRAHAPGQGLLALPGGFIEQRETLWQSCLRELAEETHCALPQARLRAALRGVAVFDHPDRSQRGRIIGHVHHFDLGDAPLPEVRGGDDASEAQWTPIAQLPALEARFHDDHFHILDHFLGLTQFH